MCLDVIAHPLRWVNLLHSEGCVLIQLLVSNWFVCSCLHRHSRAYDSLLLCLELVLHSFCFRLNYYLFTKDFDW